LGIGEFDTERVNILFFYSIYRWQEAVTAFFFLSIHSQKRKFILANKKHRHNNTGEFFITALPAFFSKNVFLTFEGYFLLLSGEFPKSSGYPLKQSGEFTELSGYPLKQSGEFQSHQGTP